MHFSIPDTQELLDESGNSYLGYNIHINGLFHCTVRYKQLHNLHEQLIKDYDASHLSFPPKKFFPLTINQQEDRRGALEKYIQSIGQNTTINNSPLLNGFLLNAQLETEGRNLRLENLNIYLHNWQKITLEVINAENSKQVLKKLCRHMKLPERYDSYFSLFITVQDEDDNLRIVRKLQDFESPVITLKAAQRSDTKIIFGKWFWDIGYDLELIHDSVALNLLYIQTVAEVERGWIVVPKQMRHQLVSHCQHIEKKEYLNLARGLKYYGYIQFAPCVCDYPQVGTKVQVAIGKNELTLRILKIKDEDQEAVFRVTRMRCWRITTLSNGVDKCDENLECSLELSFEYLMSKKQLQWITISSEQAILMSVCLQSMIDELLLKNVGGVKNQI
ncbi:sorting nexin-17 isoform X2 [Leptopilina boulardi]|uniref:sorting nexin-17 isoform X2 n=1 Tax=Leptopilina boulardi TaxID=63433 RepID=UPI0021F50654|nr:sorting nexin-17 isoform X2 [Leptopilina boulardi]